MKLNKLNIITQLTIAIGLAGPATLHADDLFRMSWRGTVYTAGANGAVVARSFSEREFVQKVATDNGLEAKSLVFVYRPQKHDTAVVLAANGQFVADVLQMELNFTDISNSGQTKIVRQAFLFDEAHDSALGSVFGTETARRDASGALLTDSFRGTFQYSIPEQNAVYSGRFSTGARVKDSSGQ